MSLPALLHELTTDEPAAKIPAGTSFSTSFDGKAQLVPDMPSNVLEINGPGSVLPQDIIFNMLKRGEAMNEIADALGLPENKVIAIAKSAWMEEQLRAWVEQEGEDSTHTLRAIMKAQAYAAIKQIGSLITCENKTVSLGACRLALEYVLVPAKEALLKRRAELPDSKENLEREYAATLAEAKALREKQTI